VLSVIAGGGKWVEYSARTDTLCPHSIVTAERRFWRCVERGGKTDKILGAGWFLARHLLRKMIARLARVLRIRKFRGHVQLIEINVLDFDRASQ